MLLAAGVKVTSVLTTRPNEAMTIAELKAEHHRDVTGIICCGGDGLVAEVLLKRHS
jgi:diacylglycerol kinase family enzyme